MRLRPISITEAKAFIRAHHRHHKPPAGAKFAISCVDESGTVVGVVTAGRPVARALDPTVVCEVNRTCVVDGARNANSMLYGADRRAAAAMGYLRVITYTQDGETGASLRAAGFRADKELPPLPGWSRPSRERGGESGGVARTRWVWP